MPANTSEEKPMQNSTTFPTVRPRRLRQSAGLRRLVRQTSLTPADFIYPMFIIHGQKLRKEVTSRPPKRRNCANWVSRR
jgi:delta-aminolevulinic acid dehydratase/porphobilinogen synthase